MITAFIALGVFIVSAIFMILAFCLHEPVFNIPSLFLFIGCIIMMAISISKHEKLLSNEKSHFRIYIVTMSISYISLYISFIATSEFFFSLSAVTLIISIVGIILENKKNKQDSTNEDNPHDLNEHYYWFKKIVNPSEARKHPFRAFEPELYGGFIYWKNIEDINKIELLPCKYREWNEGYHLDNVSDNDIDTIYINYIHFREDFIYGTFYDCNSDSYKNYCYYLKGEIIRNFKDLRNVKSFIEQLYALQKCCKVAIENVLDFTVKIILETYDTEELLIELARLYPNARNYCTRLSWTKFAECFLLLPKDSYSELNYIVDVSSSIRYVYIDNFPIMKMLVKVYLQTCKSIGSQSDLVEKMMKEDLYEQSKKVGAGFGIWELRKHEETKLYDFLMRRCYQEIISDNDMKQLEDFMKETPILADFNSTITPAIINAINNYPLEEIPIEDINAANPKRWKAEFQAIKERYQFDKNLELFIEDTLNLIEVNKKTANLKLLYLDAVRIIAPKDYNTAFPLYMKACDLYGSIKDLSKAAIDNLFPDMLIYNNFENIFKKYQTNHDEIEMNQELDELIIFRASFD